MKTPDPDFHKELREHIMAFMHRRCDGTLHSDRTTEWALHLEAATSDDPDPVGDFITELAEHLRLKLRQTLNGYAPASYREALKIATSALTVIAELPEVRSGENATTARRTLDRMTQLLVQNPDTPTPCDPIIYREGEVVQIISGGKQAVEGLVQEANRHTPHQMDWHYFGGRAVIKTLGDVDQAREALRRALPVFM